MVVKEMYREFLRDPKKGLDVIVGYYRLLFLNTFLVRGHIREQYWYRCKVANRCLKNGSCYCGCVTPVLFLCNRECYLWSLDKDIRFMLSGKTVGCYGVMLGAVEWQLFRDYRSYSGILKKDK